MKITDVQEAMIYGLDTEQSIETLRMCEENLGLLSVDEYHDLTGINKRTIYDHIDKGKLKTIVFCKSKLIVMNE